MKKLLVLILCLSSTMLFAQELHYVIDNTGTEAMQTTVTGVFMVDGVEIYNGEGMQNAGGGSLEIGVFDADGICRGAKLPTWRAKSNQWIYQLKIRGNDGMTYPTFKVYDHATETELDLVLDIEETIEWSANGKYGSTTAPYSINFTNPNAGQTFTKEIVGYGQDTSYPGGYYLIASPVIEDITPSAANGFITNGYDFYWYDHNAVGEEWQNFKPIENSVGQFNVVNGTGYLYASQVSTTLTFTGTPYSGDGIVTLTYNQEHLWSSGNDSYYWNLIGNPFPVAATVDHEFYVMNDNGDDFMTGSDAVQAMEGIFVNATAEGETVTFTPEESKSNPSLALNLTQGRGIVDRAVIRFSEGRMLPKFQMNPNHTKVYIPQDGNDYAVVRAGEMGEMPVSFKAENNGTYTLSFTAEEVSFNYLHLIDNLTGADVDLLATPSYSFNATTADYASRFRLVFATGNSESDSFGFFSDGNFIVSNEGNATLQVIDVTGRILRSETINGSASINVGGAAGVYMIRLINGENVKVQKVVVR